MHLLQNLQYSFFSDDSKSVISDTKNYTGFVTLDGTQYHFKNTGMSQSNAQDYCRSLGCDVNILTTETDAELQTIRAFLNDGQNGR